jgi:hypothetical protein
MDTENFLLKRRALLERLEERRSKDLASYPFRMGDAWGIKLPGWVRWALTLVPTGGLVSRFIQIGLPLAVPFLFKKQTPLISRLLARLFPSES